jgi:hypothetical protein
MPYTPTVSVIEQEKIGTLYHLGLGTTTPGLTTPDRVYGYMLVADQQLGRFIEKTDLHAKDQLTQYSSSELIDRDFVNTPRVSQGDFSGGAFQVNFLDSARYWDSDLEPRIPGYLTLRPFWTRTQVAAGIGATTPPQVVSYKSAVYFTFGEANGNVYKLSTTGVTTLAGSGIACKLMDTDARLIYLADGVNTLKSFDGVATFATISAAIGAIQQMWVVNQGTSGLFLYYTTDNVTLLKVDLSNNTIGITVPLGQPLATGVFIIVDVVGYLGGVAILTRDRGPGGGFDIWYHDGANLQRLIRVNQYIPIGMTVCLGQLFVTARSIGLVEPPVLLRVSSGSFEILVRFGISGISNPGITVGAPRSSGQYVFFALANPAQQGIVSAAAYMGIYDVLRGSYSHAPPLDATDALDVNNVRTFEIAGRQLVIPMVIGTTSYVQWQAQAGILPTATGTYAPTGWMVSSRMDFNTPAITKLFRRIIVYHAALKAGEQLTVNAYVDTDPVIWTSLLAVNPAGATVTNPTVGSTITVLTLPLRTRGQSLFWAAKLTAGTGQGSTPTIFYGSIEIAVPWTWEGWLDLTHKRRMLNGEDDSQGCTVLDLYWLLHNAWENAQPVTLFHPNGTSYTAAIEELTFEAFNPVNVSTPEHPPGIEWWCHILLRDSVV